jgi:hypothetical protein
MRSHPARSPVVYLPRLDRARIAPGHPDPRDRPGEAAPDPGGFTDPMNPMMRLSFQLTGQVTIAP